MTTFMDENKNQIEAENYQQAAEYMYGQGRSYQKRSQTTYTQRRRNAKGEGWADVQVYQPGEKIGSFYGVGAATPQKHTLRRI